MIAPVSPRIVAIDPGSTVSGVVVYDSVVSEPVVYAGVMRNDVLQAWLRYDRLPLGLVPMPPPLVGPHELAVEFPVAQGMPASNELFATVEWIGVFRAAWGSRPFHHVARPDVKLHLCGQARAKDANVRAAILDRFGGKDAAVGRKATPGPLYEVASHAWAALAVALTHADRATLAVRAGQLQEDVT